MQSFGFSLSRLESRDVARASSLSSALLVLLRFACLLLVEQPPRIHESHQDAIGSAEETLLDSLPLKFLDRCRIFELLPRGSTDEDSDSIAMATREHDASFWPRPVLSLQQLHRLTDSGWEIQSKFASSECRKVT